MAIDNLSSLSGRVAVVTGGSSGIGAASVRLIAAAGARVVVGYNRGADRAAALIGELPGAGHKAMYLPLEDTAQIRKVAAAVRDAYGRADILVNSAGFTRMVAHHDLEALDDDLIDAVLTANVRGPFATIRAFAPLLRKVRARGNRQYLFGGGTKRNRQLDHLWRVESSSQYDEHGACARAGPGDPGHRRGPGDGTHRICARPHRRDDGGSGHGDAIETCDRSTRCGEGSDGVHNPPDAHDRVDRQRRRRPPSLNLLGTPRTGELRTPGSHISWAGNAYCRR